MEEVSLVSAEKQSISKDEEEDIVPYERLRAKNIKEKEEMFKHLFPDVDEGDVFKDASKLLVDPAKGAGVKKVERVQRKRKPIEAGEELVRRSERKRKNFNYNYDRNEEDDDDKEFKLTPRGKKGRIDAKLVKLEIINDDNPIEAITRVLRPKTSKVYAEYYEPQNDDFIFCEICRKVEFHGCEKHPPNFCEPAHFDLEISPSTVAANSGEGVYNRGMTIPVGTLFGPYTGQFIPQENYNEIITAKKESGNAWEIRNTTMTKVIGVCDPGSAADGSKHWMSKINCPANEGEQNLVSFQLHGHIYYKVFKPVVVNAELLVFYGGKYAEEMGIDMSTFRKFKGEENHRTEGASCSYCAMGFVDQGELDEHLGKGAGRRYCRVKVHQEMIRTAGQPGREHVCATCGKGFKTAHQLQTHYAVHTGLKPFSCQKCENVYSTYANLSAHVKAVHGLQSFKCSACRKCFGYKCNMDKHFKTVHERTKDFKCTICGRTFSEAGSLTRHTKTVHNKQRDHRCPYCDQAFGIKQQMETHVNAIHLKLKEACKWPGCTYSGLPGVRMDHHR